MSLDQDALRTLSGAHATSVAFTPKRRKWRKWIIAGAILATLIIGMGLLGGRPLDVTMISALALPGDAPPAAVLDASGFVVARRQATVSAKITGKVMELHIEEGMAVKAGQILARLDASQANLQHVLAERQIEAATANLNQVKVRLAEAQRTLTRTEKLQKDGMVSESALDAARADVAALNAQQAANASELSVARSTLNLRSQDLEDLVVRAPFDGVVISKDAQPGEMVSPISAGGGYTRTGIATIVDMDSREIEVDVNESFINRVYDGQQTEATLDAYPDWRIKTHVINVVPAADRQKATVRVRIGFDQLDPRILPDMGVKVRFLQDAATNARARNAGIVLAPGEVLVKNGDKSAVWTVVDGVARRIDVKLGNTRDANTEVVSGIKAGDLLITNPPAALKDGARVRVAAPATR
jgi:RND family efflux transporter MFP subunit